MSMLNEKPKIYSFLM